jgi:hypothetical protein
MRAPALLLAACFSLAPFGAGSAETSSFVATRRVNVSLAFSGQRVFLYGEAPEGTVRVVSVIEGPTGSPVRLLQKGRVAFFWLGVRQYRLGGVPGLYLVDANCPLCNRPSDCPHATDEASWNRVLAPLGYAAGRSALRDRADLECLSGPLKNGELDTVLNGYWEVQAGRGLFAVKGNAVRLNAARSYYHTFSLPPQSPDGRYLIATYFLSGDSLLAVEGNELFVRKAGLIATLSRLAEKRAAVYGVVTILIALAAGWVAGTLFRRGGGH